MAADQSAKNVDCKRQEMSIELPLRDAFVTAGNTAGSEHVLVRYAQNRAQNWQDILHERT